MGEILLVNCSGTKKAVRGLEKNLDRFFNKNKRYELKGISDYTKVKGKPWLRRIVLKVEDKSNDNQPRARPGLRLMQYKVVC